MRERVVSLNVQLHELMAQLQQIKKSQSRAGQTAKAKQEQVAAGMRHSAANSQLRLPTNSALRPTRHRDIRTRHSPLATQATAQPPNRGRVAVGGVVREEHGFEAEAAEGLAAGAGQPGDPLAHGFTS